jgi:acyl-CoA thioester hydrolase
MTEFPNLETHLQVLPEWIDENGHMTANSFLPAFDLATETFFKYLDIDWIYNEYSLYTMGMNLDFRRELLQGNPLSIKTTLLDFDHKRIHLFHQMFQSDVGYLAATNEILLINVSLETRRSAPFSDVLQDRLRGLLQLNEGKGSPPNAFRQLKIIRNENTEE